MSTLLKLGSNTYRCVNKLELSALCAVDRKSFDKWIEDGLIPNSNIILDGGSHAFYNKEYYYTIRLAYQVSDLVYGLSRKQVTQEIVSEIQRLFNEEYKLITDA